MLSKSIQIKSIHISSILLHLYEILEIGNLISSGFLGVVRMGTITERHERTFWCEKLYLNCSEGYISVRIFQNSMNCTSGIYYTSKLTLKRKGKNLRNDQAVLQT